MKYTISIAVVLCYLDISIIGDTIIKISLYFLSSSIKNNIDIEIRIELHVVKNSRMIVVKLTLYIL